MKSNQIAIIGILAVAVIAVLAFTLSSGLKFSIVPDNLSSSENIFYQPLIGSMCCERSDTRITQYASESYQDCVWFLCKEFHKTSITCSDNVDSAGCDISVKGLQGGLNVNDLFFQEFYADGTCRYPNTQGCNDAWAASKDFMTNYEKPLTNIKPGSRIEIRADIPFVAFKKFTPYVLKIRGSTGGINTFNSESCRVERTNQNSIVDIDQIITKATLNPKPGYYEYLYKDTVPFTECINYIDGNWIPTLVEFAPILNGNQVACSAGSIYSIGTITLKDGTTIKATNSVIGTYSPTSQYKCCPGMQTTTQFCDADWQWHNKATEAPQCTVNLQCQQGQFIGGWMVDANDNKAIVRGKCENGKCNFNSERIVVECTNNGQCSGSKPMCDVGNTWKCIASEGGIIPGGDDNQDGGNANANFELWNFIWAGLAGLLTFLITGKKSIQSKDGVGMAISLVLAIVAAIITYTILINLMAILLGIAIFGLFGGVLLYFAGGAVLAVVLVLMSIVNAVRGK
jgi:hypothetical protein